MALTDLVDAPAVPFDVPEGRAQVLVSATLFALWCERLGVEIVEWGEPQHYAIQGDLYQPVLRDKP